MTVNDFNLAVLGWPLSRMGEMVENLARRSKLISSPTRLPQPSQTLAQASSETIGRWIDTAAGHIGLEVEAVESLYTGVEHLIHAGGPAIMQMPGALEFDQPILGFLSM